MCGDRGKRRDQALGPPNGGEQQPGLEPTGGVLRPPREPYLEVQMWPRAAPAYADPTDRLAGCNAHTAAHENPLEMRVEAHKPIAVVDFDHAAKRTVPARAAHDPFARGSHEGSPRCREIEPPVGDQASAKRARAPTETARDDERLDRRSQRQGPELPSPRALLGGFEPIRIPQA